MEVNCSTSYKLHFWLPTCSSTHAELNKLGYIIVFLYTITVCKANVSAIKISVCVEEAVAEFLQRGKGRGKSSPRLHIQVM
jgi:hypothetical protein